MEPIYFKFKTGKIEFDRLPFKGGSYKKEDTVLDIKEKRHEKVRILELKLIPRNKNYSELLLAYPLITLSKIIVPDTGRYFMYYNFPHQVYTKSFRIDTHGFGNPFVAFVGPYGKFEGAFGLLGRFDELTFDFVSPGITENNTFLINQGRLEFRVKFENCRNNILKFVLIDEAKTWWHALKIYAQLQKKEFDEKEPEPDERAFEPIFCTWLVENSDYIDEKWIFEMAENLQKLSIKTYILDDGWYGHGSDTNSGILDIGDWPENVPGKFESITETLKRLKVKGFYPVLWYCPICVGPYSRAFEKFKNLLVKVDGKLYKTPGNTYALCPMNPQARKIMVENALKLKEYGAMGLKIDLFEYLPARTCEAEHEHDVNSFIQGIRLSLKEMKEKLLKKDKRFLISLSNNYGNVEMASFSTVIRGGDSPFDPDILFLRSVYPAAYKKIVHNDYAMWTNKERDLALLLIKQITAGVPAFSVDFRKLPDSQKKLVEKWLDFYKKHVAPKMIKGEFEPVDPELKLWVRYDEKEAVYTLLYPEKMVDFMQIRPVMFLLNASSQKIFLNLKGKFKVTIFNHFFEPMKEINWNFPDWIELVTGGIAYFKKQEEK